jgi:hypothetical protein
MKLAVILLTALLAASPGRVKELNLSWPEERTVAAGDELKLEVKISFFREACDFAPTRTSFYARGAQIIGKSDWKRIDKGSFTREITIRLKDEKQATVTARIQVHEQKTVSQLEIDIGQ